MRSRLHHAGALVALMTAVNLISSSVEVAAITIAGYTTDTDVTEHSELDLDVQEIEDLSGDFNFTGAYYIYANGKNSEKTEEMRTIRGFSTDADGKLTGEPWFDIYEDYWGAPDYADLFTSAACNGTGDFAGESDVVRAECCTKGAQYQNIWMYVIHELEDAITDCNDEDLSANDGGVEAWDEGWAFWAGSLEGEYGEGDGVMGYALADYRCTQFGTCTGDDDDNDFEGTSAVNYELLELYNEGKSKLPDFECNDVEVIKEEIVTLMTVPLIQGLLRYVYLADPNGEDDDADDDEQNKESAELWAFSAAVLPQINNCSQEVAEFVRSNTDITSDNAPISDGYAAVKEKIESVYSCMGITCYQVGGYSTDGSTYVEGMEPCTIMIAGYTTDTDVTEHSKLDLDMEEIEDLSDAYDFDGAYSIYANGKYSEKTEEMRTIRGFSTDADGKLTGEPWFDIYEDYWGAPDYADLFTSAACNGTGDFAGESDVVRAECCTKGAQYQNIWMYVIHELEDAITDCNDEDLTDNDGGVEAWDEGWAFWAGSLEGEYGEGNGVMGYALADYRCTQFGTCTGDDDDNDFEGTSAVNYELLELYNEGKSKLPDFKCDDVEDIKEEIVTLMTVPLIQGLLRYVYLADPDGEDDDADDDEQNKESAELWAFSAAVLPLIDNCDSEVAEFVRSNTDITSDNAPISDGYAAVKEKIESVYSCMGITCYQVGGYSTDGSTYVEGMEPCVGMMIAGYTTDSDVTEHSELDLDMEEIEELSDAYNFTGAYNIYANGKYSEKTEAMRTIQGFSTSAEEKLSGEPWFNIYEDYWGAPDYADLFTSAACQGTGDFAGESDVVKAECCTKGAQYQNIWMYVIHELEDAIADCNKEDLSANDGGVEAWDEGWAFWAGSLEGEYGEGDGVMGYALADNRCMQFGTCTGDDDDNDFEGTSAVNYELLELYNEGKSKLPDFKCDDVEDIKEEIVTLMTVPLIQGLLRYVYLADPNGEDDDADDDEQDKERAELWAFSAAVLPLIDNCDSEVAEFVRSNTDITSDDAPISDGYAAVKEKLESVYSCMDIKCSQVGGYSTDGSTYVEGMEPCSDSSNGTEDWEIAVGVIVGLIVVGAAICLCVHCRRKKRARQAQAQAKTMGDDVGGFEMETGTSTL